MDWSSEFQKLHSLLEQQFTRQWELLSEVHDRLKTVQQGSHPAALPPMTSRKTSVRSSVIRENSVYHSTSSLDPVPLGESMLAHAGMADGSVPSSVETDADFDVCREDAEFEYEERPRRGRSRRRDSSRHSFVRRTLEAHQQKADKEAFRLKGLRSKSVQGEQKESSWLATQIEKLVASKLFSNGIMMLILLNVVLLGVEVDVSTVLGQSDVPRWFGVANTIIVMIFVLEVALKCFAVGLTEYWCGHDACWNAFDGLIITVSVFETTIDIWAQSMSADVANSSHLRVIRTIRLARALRGVRVVRLFRYVSALRTLALCIVSTIGSLIWTLVLLVLLFYTFGVILTQLVSDHCRDQIVLETGDLNAVPRCPDDLHRYGRVFLKQCRLMSNSTTPS